MKYRLQHYTAYQYSKPVNQCHNELRMRPISSASQQVNSCKIEISPTPDAQFERLDYFGNGVTNFSIHRSHTQLIVHSIVDVESLIVLLDNERAASLNWEMVHNKTQSQLDYDTVRAKEFLYPSELIPYATPDIHAYAARFFTPGRKILDALLDLTKTIFSEFKYKPGFTNVTTQISEIMQHKKGVCQDFAHFAIACVRSMGIAARYVSGYLETLPPPGKEKLIGADASHAWFSAYIPDIGWVDFDPTNNQRANEQYITLATGRDYADVTPLKGVVYGGGAHTLEVRVDMRPYDGKHVNLFNHTTTISEETTSNDR